MIVYGIPTCETCRKAIAALRGAGHDVDFQDVRKDPLTPPQLKTFHEAFGDRLVNRSSATWRKLSEEDRNQAPLQLLAANPTLMKRPLIDTGEALFLGWTKDVQAELLG